MSELITLSELGTGSAAVVVSVAIIKVADYFSSKKRNENGHSKNICIKEQTLQRVETSATHAHERIDGFQEYCRDQHQKVERELGGITENVKAIKEDVSFLRNKADK